MLHLHSSNRVEHLVQALAQVVSQPLPTPLEKEVIVVQSRGMERWVSMKLAEQLGVWTNGSFPFPDSMIWRLFKEVLGFLPEASSFEAKVMTWYLMDILPQWITQPEFVELSHYLQDDESHVKQFQFAWRVANLFDQYLIYRPQWLADWEKNTQPRELANDEQAQWQAILWRALVQQFGTHHPAKLRANFFKQLAEKKLSLSRLSIFGIPALPPFHLEVLAELGSVIEVHVFLLNPSQVYWGDIVSDSEIAHKTVPFEGKPKTPEALYLEKGNTLLASWGKMGRDFIEMLNDYPQIEHHYFDQPEENQLLPTIQADILLLQEHPEAERVLLSTEDRSCQIHACHSRMREVEVLYDQLLARFEADSQLLPKDIVVMVPDIETYAPLIEAVFATPPTSNKKIPFSIADRSLRHKSALVNAFLAMLELSHSRFTISEVLNILETPAVQKRFALLEADLGLIRRWIKQTGIRWGIDGDNRAQMQLPAFEENTWRAGLKRLLLGYALPPLPLNPLANDSTEESAESETLKSDQLFSDRQERLFLDLLPFQGVEGSEALVLGKLVTFTETLFQYLDIFKQSRPLSAWVEFLKQLLARFFTPENANEADDIQMIHARLHQMLEDAQRATFQAPVSHQVMLLYLRQILEAQAQPDEFPFNFITGSVLFCAMRPMRSIPFQGICLLGMNDQDYPRSSKPLNFDLITQNPQRGDRSRRQNDRYLFLEALLSARQFFYISYVGQNVHDNTVIPPSVLVSELQDYIQKNFIHPSSTLAYLITQHPLQAFSPRYFNQTETRLFSYSNEYCAASTVLLNERHGHSRLNQQGLPLEKQFFQQPLPEPASTLEWQTCELNRLIRFLTHPIRFLLTQRLGIELVEQEQTWADETEPFEIKGLERYSLSQTLVEKQLTGYDLKPYQAITKAKGLLPHGRIGDYLYSRMTEEIQLFITQVQQAMREKKRDSLAINLTFGDKRLIGRLGGIRAEHLVYYRYGKLKAKDHIRIWLGHLIINSLPNDALPRHSLLIGANGTFEYQPINDSLTILPGLLEHFYWQGLKHPLYFFPESSMTYVEKIFQGKTESEAFEQAWNTWHGNDFAKGEKADDYYQLCFGHWETTPLENESFKKLARQFFEPLLAHRTSRT